MNVKIIRLKNFSKQRHPLAFYKSSGKLKPITAKPITVREIPWSVKLSDKGTQQSVTCKLKILLTLYFNTWK
jgi:hypothetical protein